MNTDNVPPSQIATGMTPVEPLENVAVKTSAPVVVPTAKMSNGLIFFAYALFIVVCTSLVVLMSLYGPPSNKKGSTESTSFETENDATRLLQQAAANSFPAVNLSETNSGSPVEVVQESFPAAESTWSSKFSLDTSSLAKDVYTLVYFDRDNPQATKQLTNSDDLFLNYGLNEQNFYRISTEKLAVYFVGRKVIEKTSKYKISIDSGWSSARVLIDKKVIFEGKQNKELWINLEKGDHLIEVEFLSGWHVPGITVSFLSAEEAIKRGFQNDGDAFVSGVPIWYVGIYEPVQDKVSLSLPKDKGDITLVLSSYEKTKWKVNPAQGTKVVSVFVASYKAGSSVDGLESTAKVVYSKELTYLGMYELYPKCNIYFSSTDFYCDGLDNYKQFFSTMDQLSGGSAIATFTGDYSTSSLVLPSKYLASNERQKLDAYAAEVRQDWQNLQKK